MAGKISFGDEEEFAQTEALAARMIEDTATQHLAVGQRVSHISYETATWHPDLLIVDNLTIEFVSGLKIKASQARLDLEHAPGEFREALRAENARQRPTAPSSPARAEGERLQARPGPKLDPLTGDPIECQLEDVDESAGERFKIRGDIGPLLPGPELDVPLKRVGTEEGEYESHVEYPIGPPTIDGTDITEDA